MFNIGTPITIIFSFGTNGKCMSFGVLILRHIKVCNLNVIVNLIGIDSFVK